MVHMVDHPHMVHMVEHPHMVLWVVILTSHGKPIELFLIPANGPRLVQHRVCIIVPCLYDGAYEKSISVNRKE